ncbi:hypothetical protein [Streptomyces sp. NPDC051183]|uniref:hypothetical protein n=1 Tax=Streptomyces sp. NPDC051183 TaxID=3155165 RepID=UPI003437F4A7
MSTGTQASPTLIRIGPEDMSWVSDPSGFAHSVVCSLRAPVTSIRRLFRRAASSADASSEASVTGAAAAGACGAAAAGAAVSTSSATPVSTSSPSAASTAIRRTLRIVKAPPANAGEA